MFIVTNCQFNSPVSTLSRSRNAKRLSVDTDRTRTNHKLELISPQIASVCCFTKMIKQFEIIKIFERLLCPPALIALTQQQTYIWYHRMCGVAREKNCSFKCGEMISRNKNRLREEKFTSAFTVALSGSLS